MKISTLYPPLLVAGTMMAAPSAMAFTVHDLVADNGMQAIETLYFSKRDRMPDYEGLDYQYPGDAYGLGKGFHFEYVRDLNGTILPKYVKAVGLRTAPNSTGAPNYVDKDFIFTIADASNNPVEDGTRLILPNDVSWSKNNTIYASCVSTDGKLMLGALWTLSPESLKQYVDMVDIVPFYYRYGYRSGYSFKLDEANWVGEMTATADGIRIQFDNGAIAYPTGYNSTYGYGIEQTVQNNLGKKESAIIDKMTIEVFRPAGTFEFKEYGYTFGDANYSSTGTQKTAYLRTVSDEDGNMGICNLTGRGYTRSLGAEGGARFYPGLWKLKMDNGSLVLAAEQNIDVAHNNALGTYGARTGGYQETLATLTAFPSRQHTRGDVAGKVTEQGDIHHTTLHDNNFWVNPGHCRTYLADVKAEFPMFAGVFFGEPVAGTTIYHSTPAWGDGQLSLDRVDVTLQGDVVEGVLGVGPERLWPRFTFEVYGNDTWVDSYTLWMMPVEGAQVARPEDGHDDYTHANGHPTAFAVATVKASSVTGDYPRRYLLQRRFERSEMLPGQCNEEDRYIFYVQANYAAGIQPVAPKAASSRATTLPGTFHGFFGNYETTGASDVAADLNMIKVTTTPGLITVTGANAPVSVYALDGRTVYEASVQPEHRINTSAGVYIVRSGHIVRKVSLM